MNKQFLDAVDMLSIAAQHAYCAEYLLKHNAEVVFEDRHSVDALHPITSLIYTAFELTLKAFVIRDHSQVRQYKSLAELLELNHELGLSKQEGDLILNLSRHQAFRKGVDYCLWESREQLQAFCEQVLSLYERLQQLMPVELQQDYQ